MTEEVKRISEILHERGCRGCVVKEVTTCIHRENYGFCDNFYHEAADLIESLSATCDQLTDALKTRGFENVEAVFAEMDQVKRERDAAIRDMQKTPITLCAACSHYHTEFCCAGGEGCEGICMTIACSMFEWRNIQEEG